MADYTVRIEATTEEAEKKLKRVDNRVEKLERGATIDIRVPSAQETLNVLQKITTTTATVAKQALDISRTANIGPGAVLNDLEDLFGIVAGGGKKAVSAMEALSRATPTNILGTAFTTASDQATKLSRNLAAVGYEIFGLTQSVGILRQAFGGLFDETIGREIRLQESLLRTRTTLASTADVAVNGKRITDPYEALVALEGPVDQALENIRRRSLDIAGTTSDAIVQMFGVVAGQVGQFGGTLKDAEDLAITFAGALGTIGMADPNLASQEVRSILTGTIDQNSVLARSLGLTNEDIQKAKTSAEGLTAFLTKRLEAFTAGQKIAAQGFAGITSNIQEIREEASRSLGKPLLQPLLDSLTAVYKRMSLVFEQILSIADGLGRIGATAFAGVMSGIQAAPILQGFSERDQLEGFKRVDQAVASLAVKAQTEIDKLRPLIARIANEVITAVALVSQGVFELAKGFASFKFEQFKVVANSFATLAQVLNASVIPLLSQVLKLYGEILALPPFQFITQMQAQLQILERVGILPIARLAYFWQFAFKESVTTAINWVKKGAEFIGTAAQSILNALSGAISGIGGLIKNLGSTVIQGITVAVNAILSLIANAAARIRVTLLDLAASLSASMDPAMLRFAGVITQAANAFGSISKGANQAKVSVQDLSVKGKQAMQQLGAAADNVAQKTRNLGSTIASGLGKAVNTLKDRVAGLVVGFIKFQAGLIAMEQIIGFLVNAAVAYQRAQENISEQTRAELAIKRLSTTYANLGDNASAAAKALKKVEDEIVSNRLDKVTKSYGELSNKLSDIAKLQSPQNIGDYAKGLASMLNPANFDVRPQLKDGGGQETFVEALFRTRRDDFAKLRKELETLAQFETKRTQETNDRQNVQILARERKDIETAVLEFRKDLEKELNDERFRTARELATLEQSLREEGRRAERSEIERRIAREQEGLVGVQANIAQILGDYEKGLFDAQTEAQRKQFEAVEARENLEKSIADYKLKLEEQTTKMRKRMGDYNRQVADYETAQADRRNKERIKTELRAAAIQAERFVLTPEEKDKFKNAASRAGVSSTQALALLKTPGVIEQLGIQPDSGNYEGLIEALSKNPNIGQLLRAPQGQFIEFLNNRLQNFGAGAGKLTYDTSVEELNNQRDFQRTIAPPPKLKGFDSLNIDREFVAARRALNERILNLSQTLNELINTNSLKENFQRAQDALSRVSLFTDIPDEQQAKQATEDLQLQLKLLGEAASVGSRSVSTLDSALGQFDLTLTRAAEQFIASSKDFANLNAKQKTDLTDALVKSMEISLGMGQATPSAELVALFKSLNITPEFQKLFKTLLDTVIRARRQIERVAPILDQNEQLQFLAQDLQAFNADNRNLIRNTKVQALDTFGQLAAGASPLAQRQFEADMINLRRQLEYQDRGIANTAEGREQLKQLAEQTRRTYTQLGLFEEELRGISDTIGLVKDLAQTYTDGLKSVINEALQNGDIKGATTGMLQAIRDRVVGAFLDYSMQPVTKMIEDNLLKFLKTPSTEELAAKYQQELMQVGNAELAVNNTNLATLNTTISNAISVIQGLGVGGPLTGIGGPVEENANTSGLKYGIRIGDMVGELNAKPATKPPRSQQFDSVNGPGGKPVPLNVAPTQALPTIEWTPASENFSQTIQKASENLSAWTQKLPQLSEYTDNLINSTSSANTGLSNVGAKGQQTNELFSSLQKSMANAVGVLGGLAMAIGGAQTMGGGGTYNTLMGLAGIFGAISSVAGGIGGLFNSGGGGGGGAFNFKPVDSLPSVGSFNPLPSNFSIPSFAGGGYTGPGAMAGGLDGRGGFMAMLHPNETVIPGNPYAATTAALENAAFSNPARFSSEPIKLETRVINGVEYATVDQLEQATRQAEMRGAQRGQAMAFNSMRNNVKTRKQLGMT